MTNMLGLHVVNGKILNGSGEAIRFRGFDYTNMRWYGDAKNECTEQQFIYMKEAGSTSVQVEIWAPYVMSQGQNIFAGPSFLG